jgi:hypothetical protein
VQPACGMEMTAHVPSARSKGRTPFGGRASCRRPEAWPHAHA